MQNYVNKLLAEVPEDMMESANKPANVYLFQICKDALLLKKKERVRFYDLVAKILFLCK